MVPVIVDGKRLLKCRVCGYVEEITEGKEYKLSKPVEEAKRVRTGRVSVPAKPLRREEEREMLQEYYEIFLETFTEESEGEE